MFQWLGLIITLIVWLGLAFLLLRWRNHQLNSISAHGAALVFKVVLVGGGLAYYWWLVGWYAPHLHLSNLFVTILTVVIAYQIFTGLNNGNAGFSKDLHDYTSQTMALLYIPLTVLIVGSHELNLTAHIICTCLLIYMVNSYVIVEIMKRLKPIHLIFQLAYVVAFQLVILVSAYLA